MKLAAFLVVLVVVADIFGTSDALWWDRRRRSSRRRRRSSRRRSCHTPQTSTVAYANHWDQPFTYRCPYGHALTHVRSMYSSCHRDRVFKFGCAHTLALKRGQRCSWTGWVNNYDQLIHYKCTNNGFLTGIGSKHHHRHEDRRFKFRCCYNPRYIHYNCKYTRNYVNNWRAVINFRTPRRFYLVGATSFHDNGQEDRRWKFEYCQALRFWYSRGVRKYAKKPV